MSIRRIMENAQARIKRSSSYLWLLITGKHADTYCLRALFHLFLCDGKGAFNDFTEAIRMEPRDALAYEGRGAARLVIGDTDGAIEDFTQALALNPKNCELLVSRGELKSYNGDLKGAIDDYAAALQINPNRYLTKNWCDYIRHLSNEKIETHYYTQAIRNNPLCAGAYQTRAAIRLLSRDPESAIEDLNQALAIDPSNAPAHALRGLSKFAIGDKKGSVDDYTEAIRIDPDKVFYRLRAEARRGAGDEEGAKQDFIEADRIASAERK